MMHPTANSTGHAPVFLISITPTTLQTAAYVSDSHVMTLMPAWT